MSMARLDPSELESICIVAQKFNLQKIRHDSFELEFFGHPMSSGSDESASAKKKPEVSDDDILINPMAGLENG